MNWAVRLTVLLVWAGSLYSLEAQVERGPWSGAVTPNSIVVKAKLRREGSVARLRASPTPDWTRSVFSPADTALAERNRVVTFRLMNLKPNTLYFYLVEVDGRADQTSVGRFRTFPGPGPASFTFAFASCARTASTHPVFTTILRNNPLFFLHTGDFHYLDIKENDPALFRAAYDLVLSSRPQADFYRNLPIAYVWDDHDFAGNASDGNAQVRATARAIYQEYVPHYPLAFGEGDVPIAQAFSVGRVRFIVTDLRSARSDAGRGDNRLKSMMGNGQKAWFKQELLAAREKHPLIFWVSSVPWLGAPGVEPYPLPEDFAGYAHHTSLPPPASAATPREPPTQDHWCMYPTERQEIADFIVEHGMRGVCILHGDAHMLAADDGRNGDYSSRGGARIPVLAAAPLDQSASRKGGPYSQGVYLPRAGEGCFGLVRVMDLTNSIRVIYSGRNHLNEQKVSLQFEVPVASTAGAR